jgi:hypothetical protein
VTTAPGVGWRAVSREPWITLALPASPAGSGSAALVISENPNAQPRGGMVLIAGHAVRIAQAGLTPPYAVSGRVVNGLGEGVSRVTLTFTRVSGAGAIPPPVQTDGAGGWRQTGFDADATSRATPASRRQTFSPATRDFDAAAATLNFTSVGRVVIINP